MNPRPVSAGALHNVLGGILVRGFALLSVFLVAACDGSGGGVLSNRPCEEIVASGCEIAKQNQCVHTILRTEYLWYREVPAQVDYDGYASPAAMLEFLRYQTDDNSPGSDRFSYLTSEESFKSFFTQGQYLGFGFGFTQPDSAGRVWVSFVYAHSPAALAGMERGDEILSVDGQTLSDITSSSNWTNVFGPREAGFEVQMVLAKSGGGSLTITMQKTTVDINTVLFSSVIDSGGVKTGYLVLKNFLTTTAAELDTVFSSFKSAGVSRVILDLRYNGGGSVSVTNYLASYLHNTVDYNSLFSRLVFNDRNQAENTDYLLYLLENQLDLDKLIVVTTRETASASEMVINGLSPYLEVKTVGSKTYGKPVGQNPFFFCGNALLPVTFEVENRLGEGGYFDGIPADCGAQDDVAYAFGDSGDPMLNQALHLADTGSCLSLRGPSTAPGPGIMPQEGLDAIIGAI